MTLRAWAFLFLIGMFALILSAHAGTFDDMSAPTHKAHVTALESQGDSVIYVLQIDGKEQRLALCPEGKQALVGEGPMGDLLRQAFFHKNPVQVGITGPWQACLRTVRVAPGA
jgi:hypothetical protein